MLIVIQCNQITDYWDIVIFFETLLSEIYPRFDKCFLKYGILMIYVVFKKSSILIQIPMMIIQRFWPFDFLDSFIFKNGIVKDLIFLRMYFKNNEGGWWVISDDSAPRYSDQDW